MAKVLSTKMGTIMTTKNNTPPKGKPNIGPGSTAGSGPKKAINKPSGQQLKTFNFNAGTMPNKKPGTTMTRAVPPGDGNRRPEVPRGAMKKFGGGK